jgi:hypothetical protein
LPRCTPRMASGGDGDEVEERKQVCPIKKKTNQPRRSFSFSSRSRLFFILSLASLGSAAACFTGKEARFEIRDMRRGNHAVRAANERCCSRAATNFFPCGVGGRRQASACAARRDQYALLIFFKSTRGACAARPGARARLLPCRLGSQASSPCPALLRSCTRHS